MKVGIVGLGASGLRAAMLLQKAGFEVSLFESRDRVGGRLQTVQLEYGGFVDAGGEWIDADHKRVYALLQELGQSAEPSNQWPGRVLYEGEESNERDLWPDVKEAVDAMDERARATCSILNPVPWLNTNAAELDAAPIAKWFDEASTTPRARWWLEAITKSDEGDGSDVVSILGWLAGYRLYLDRQGDEMSAARMSHGGQGMCEAMLESTGLTPRLNCPLESVDQSGDKVKLVFADHITDVDLAILAIPPWPLRKVTFEPKLPKGKFMGLQRIGMSPSVKIAWRFSKAFWHDMNWSGRLITNKAFQQIWDGTRNGGEPVLIAYINGDDALWLNHEKLGDRCVDWMFDEFSEVVPEAREHYLGGLIFDWARDPWACGSFSHLKPRYVLGGMEHIGTPVDRVFFAGEHTATWTGFIEGALESGERVAKEVIEWKNGSKT